MLETVEPPVSLFEKFFTDDIIKFICEESVRYAISKGNHSFTIDTNMLKALIAILLFSGYVDLPRRPMYWEHNEDTHNTIVSSLLSRNRFDKIMQNLLLADNSNLDTEDKFAKVRPLPDKLNEQCLANYLPEQLVKIVESMVPYFGRHGCKQYMRNKPVKFGYKFWVAATLLGYAIQFYPYAGMDENYDSNVELGGSVVGTLAEKLPSQVHSNYHIIMDNFFTSPNLLHILKAKGIAATETVRINCVENAHLRPIKEMEKLERGASDVVTEKNSNLTLVRWNDNKVVALASTFVGKMPLRKAHRYVQAQNGRTEIDQPQNIFLYNKGMGGVDSLDQNISSYMTGHCSKKWWWTVFRFCLDLSVNNAYQLYRQQKHSEGERKLDLLGFWRSIVDTYYRCLRKSTTTNIFPSARKLSKVSDEVRYDAINHWIGKGKQRRC